MKQQIKIFLALSAVILIVDLVFVWINYKSSYNALLNTLVRDAESTERAFTQALDIHVGELLQMAAFLAEREDFQALFLKGKVAVEEEGGGPGAEKAASVRKALYDAIKETWGVMEITYSLKELNFILAPDLIFFLRAQSPENFGDPAPQMRYTINHANNKLKPTKGFETGKTYSGIFGVAPVIVHDSDSGKKIHVGSVETGASLSIILPVLDAQLNAGVAILLSRSHLKAKMSPELFDRRFSSPPLAGNLFVESSSRPEIDSLLDSEAVPSLLFSNGTRL
ncbi:MAG: cache domain-containing protein, partial [Nitrospinales bacterium]